MSGWRKRQIRSQQMQNEDKNKELYSIKWRQPYTFGELTNLNEILDEFALSSSDLAEAKEVIKHIKSKL